MNPLKSGTLDLALLAALSEQPRYGLDILKYVNERSGGLFDLREGSLYPALHRLVKAGWVDSDWQPSDRGGAPRKVYRLTDEGTQALSSKRAEWQTLRGALDALLYELALIPEHPQPHRMFVHRRQLVLFATRFALPRSSTSRMILAKHRNLVFLRKLRQPA